MAADQRARRCLITPSNFALPMLFPKLEFSFASEFFADMEKKLPSMRVPDLGWESCTFSIIAASRRARVETERKMQQLLKKMY